MVWKILSVITILSLGGASYFAWANQSATKDERQRKKLAEENVKKAQDRKTELVEAKKAKEEQLVALQKNRDQVKDDAAKLGVAAQEKEQELQVNKTSLEQKATQVKALQDQIDQAGNIEQLVAQVEKLKKDQQDAEAAVANQQQQEALAKENLENVQKQITALRDKEARGRRGIVDPDFNARVAQYFPEWDFAILSKGNAGGVFANADLEVKRGRDVIARLKVRNVEQNHAVADLVPGSLASGNSIRPGDTVVAAANQSAAEEKKTTTPSAGGSVAGGAVQQTPPAGAAAPAAPAMSNDPFAGAPAKAPAPAAGAPAPAMGGDPFGAAPAPAPAPAAGTPAPAMGGDPFGGAPAPAGAAPAPAGGAPAPAAGTPAAPSKEDPFAPKK